MCPMSPCFSVSPALCLQQCPLVGSQCNVSFLTCFSLPVVASRWAAAAALRGERRPHSAPPPRGRAAAAGHKHLPTTCTHCTIFFVNILQYLVRSSYCVLQSWTQAPTHHLHLAHIAQFFFRSARTSCTTFDWSRPSVRAKNLDHLFTGMRAL